MYFLQEYIGYWSYIRRPGLAEGRTMHHYTLPLNLTSELARATDTRPTGRLLPVKPLSSSKSYLRVTDVGDI